MPTHFCVSGQTAEDFMRLFVNRLAYCIQREKVLSDDSAPYIKQKRPLDLGAVRMHLNGDATISLFAINPKTQSCKWVAIDADFDDALDALFELYSVSTPYWLPSAVSIFTTSRSASEFPSKVGASRMESRSFRGRIRSPMAPTGTRFEGRWVFIARRTAATGFTTPMSRRRLSSPTCKG
jgi:hypothetical protein